MTFESAIIEPLPNENLKFYFSHSLIISRFLKNASGKNIGFRKNTAECRINFHITRKVVTYSECSSKVFLEDESIFIKKNGHVTILYMSLS